MEPGMVLDKQQGLGAEHRAQLCHLGTPQAPCCWPGPGTRTASEALPAPQATRVSLTPAGQTHSACLAPHLQCKALPEGI